LLGILLVTDASAFFVAFPEMTSTTLLDKLQK
jgi:hypothetical protein